MNDLWARPNSMPLLRDGEVQIWRLDLGGSNGRDLLAHAFQALTTEERQRAARMRSGTAPEEFIAGRGFLRRLLGASLDCDPQGIGIVVGPHRKPEMRPVRGISVPAFNVSHSRGMVLIALSKAGRIGVDVEYMDASVEAIDVARGAFHEADLEQIERAATGRDRLLAFYRCWTRREAVAKADGRGLTLPASGFSTGADLGQERLVELNADLDTSYSNYGAARYYVRGLDVSPYHQGAVAITRPGLVPKLFDLSRFTAGERSQYRQRDQEEADVYWALDGK